MKCFLLFFILPSFCYCQEKFDSQIHVTKADTTNIRNRIIENFARAGYMVLPENVPNKINTYPKYIKPLGHIQIQVLFINDTITFWGGYRRNISSGTGLTVPSKEKEKIFYYGNSGKGWKILKSFADKLNGELNYSK